VKASLVQMIYQLMFSGKIQWMVLFLLILRSKEFLDVNDPLQLLGFRNLW